jgi:hypothetical protein
MIEIYFEGWFQCRLATGPAEYRDPRGGQGWTFAFGSEADLDRIIRFHDPVDLRSHAPKVGVFVNLVELNGQTAEEHPLLGGTVSLLDNPVFEGHDGAIASDAREPIAPFHLAIRKNEYHFSGRDAFDPASAADIERRKPVQFRGTSPEVLAVTGINDPVAFRRRRVEDLAAELAAETDPARRSALEARLAEARLGGIRRNSLAFQLTYEFAIRGPNQVSLALLTHGNGAVPENGDCRTRFWMGGWDADTLCGYVKGSVVLE